MIGFLFSGGGPLIFGAIIGEYVARLLHEVIGRPRSDARSRIGLRLAPWVRSP
jgi:hypothetical protein